MISTTPLTVPPFWGELISIWPGMQPESCVSWGKPGGPESVTAGFSTWLTDKVVVAVASKSRVGVGNRFTPGKAGAIKETNTNSTTAILNNKTNILADWLRRDCAFSLSKPKTAPRNSCQANTKRRMKISPHSPRNRYIQVSKARKKLSASSKPHLGEGAYR